MKKLILSISVICAALVISASDYPYIVIRQADGSDAYVKSSGLSFAVADGKLVVTHADGISQYDMSNLKMMAFAADIAFLEKLTLLGDEAVDVYNTSGVLLGHYSSVDVARSRITTPGVYSLKNSCGTAKIVIK